MLKTSLPDVRDRRLAQAWLLGLLFAPASAFAADSYRWLHVTIDTPWAIFIFLLPMVLLPVVLMAYLYWRFAGRAEADKTKKTPGDELK